MLEMIIAELDLGAILTSGATLLLTGLFFVIILTIANAKLKVERDPMVEAIEAVLPGANCGGCGLAGCSAYAEGVVKDHGLIGRCGPGGDALVHAMAEIMGIEATASAPNRAVVHCSAHSDDMINSTQYLGIAGCAERTIIPDNMGCSYGCLGGGDCQAVCEFDAIHVIEGLAVVDYNKCVGCGACVKACPRNIISLTAIVEDPILVMACSSHDKPKEVRGYCKVGCIGCTLCVKMGGDSFFMDNGLAKIDYEKYPDEESRQKATGKCPRGLMVYVGSDDVAVRKANDSREPPKPVKAKTE
ncbi:MAG: RnfABCDGE type electron transport complex subunit B [Phycisphaerae bacterium]|nr:RnfABCDGE type electron transport complex subunit B [Phycisphaerae bacterium]